MNLFHTICFIFITTISCTDSSDDFEIKQIGSHDHVKVWNNVYLIRLRQSRHKQATHEEQDTPVTLKPGKGHMIVNGLAGKWVGSFNDTLLTLSDGNLQANVSVKNNRFVISSNSKKIRAYLVRKGKVIDFDAMTDWLVESDDCVLLCLPSTSQVRTQPPIKTIDHLNLDINSKNALHELLSSSTFSVAYARIYSRN